jgi:hypothetical protein
MDKYIMKLVYEKDVDAYTPLEQILYEFYDDGNCELQLVDAGAAELASLRERLQRAEAYAEKLKNDGDDEYELWGQRFATALKGEKGTYDGQDSS